MNNLLTDQIEQWDRPLLNVSSQKIMSKHLKQLERLCTRTIKKMNNVKQPCEAGK